MKVSVTKKFTFEACHFLPRYIGACHSLHGHSYELEVTVSGPIIENQLSPKCGMILDFKDLKKMVKDELISKFDHSMLNDVFVNPTAEIMAVHIFKTMSEKLADRDLTLERVRLWETRDSYAEVVKE